MAHNQSIDICVAGLNAGLTSCGVAIVSAGLEVKELKTVYAKERKDASKEVKDEEKRVAQEVISCLNDYLIKDVVIEKMVYNSKMPLTHIAGFKRKFFVGYLLSELKKQGYSIHIQPTDCINTKAMRLHTRSLMEHSVSKRLQSQQAFNALSHALCFIGSPKAKIVKLLKDM